MGDFYLKGVFSCLGDQELEITTKFYTYHVAWNQPLESQIHWRQENCVQLDGEEILVTDKTYSHISYILATI